MLAGLNFTYMFVSQDERFNSYHSATFLLCQPVRLGSVGGVCLTCHTVALVGKENSLTMSALVSI